MESWQDLLNRADSLCDIYEYDSALSLCRIAIKEVHNELSREDTVAAAIMDRLASSFMRVAGNSAGQIADTLIRKELAIWEKTLGPDHPKIADILMKLGINTGSIGSLSETEEVYKRAIMIREKTLGPEHIDVGRALINLAGVYSFYTRYAESESLYIKGIEIEKKALGLSDLEVLWSMLYLGKLYLRQSFYEKAKMQVEKVLGAIRYNPESVASLDRKEIYLVSIVLNILAAAYFVEERYLDAISYEKQSLAISELISGPMSLSAARSLANLGSLYTMQGNYTAAESLLLRALEIENKTLGSTTTDQSAYIYRYLADLYRGQRRFQEAEAYYRLALSITESSAGPDHPEIANDLNGLFNLYCDQDKLSDAEQLLLRMIRIDEGAFGKDGRSYILDCLKLARLKQDQAKYAEADSIYQDIVGGLQDTLGAKSLNTASCYYGIAELRYAENRLAEAENMFNRALAILENNSYANPYVLGSCLLGRARLYNALGNKSASLRDAYKAYLIRRDSVMSILVWKLVYPFFHLFRLLFVSCF
ncbi:MAG: tetratricopeptide repeat protein [candidate division Zixibacteria bacterium]|nr:tetratricopeptide repeat protein [candidate division Zixibacteria bacterium]